MQLILIRHGQSTNNVLLDISDDTYLRDRHYDPLLTPLGEAQAARLAEYLAAHQAGEWGIRIDRLYASPMRRALATARPLAAALALTPVVWLDIFETGGIYLDNDDGSVTGYPGLTRAEMEAEFPGYVLPAGVTEAGWWSARRGSESRPESFARARRVADALHALAHAQPDSAVALVSHGAFLDRLIRVLLGQELPPPDRYRMLIDHNNTGITRIDLDEDRPAKLKYLNRVAHLPEDLLS